MRKRRIVYLISSILNILPLALLGITYFTHARVLSAFISPLTHLSFLHDDSTRLKDGNDRTTRWQMAEVCLPSLQFPGCRSRDLSRHMTTCGDGINTKHLLRNPDAE